MHGTLDLPDAAPLPAYPRLTALWRRLQPYLAATGVTAALLLLALLVKTQLYVANVALIFVGGVVLCAVHWGLLPALLACALGVLSLNFFFFPPIHDITVEDPENVIAALVFVGVAIFVGRLAARARDDARLAVRRAAVANELYVFAREITGIDDLEDLLALSARQVHEALGVKVVIMLADQEVLTVRHALPPVEALEPADVVQAEQCWRQQQRHENVVAGEVTAPRCLFLPLRAVNETVGVLGLGGPEGVPRLGEEDRRFVEAIADQTAVAIQRLTLVADVQRARIAAETEGLRSAMLSAISHDLKTPLASILGAATSLGTYSSYFEQQERDELVATIRDEAERMSRFIANLLDITRVESGTLEVRREATDTGEVIGAAARRGRRVLGDRRLRLRIAPELPMLAIDGVLLEQTLFNLLDNAAKYAPAQSTIEIDARQVHDQIIIKVTDEGPGIHPQDVQRIFDKFYRSGHGRRQLAGTGLGLAICRGFVEAMGGRIIAGNRTDRSGAVFMIGFPKGPPSPPLPPPDDD